MGIVDVMLTSGISFAASTSHLARNIERNNRRVAVSLEQLSTGKRINRPSDDPSGFVAAEEIRGELIQLNSEVKADTYRRIAFQREVSVLSNIQTTLHHVRGHIVTAADGLLDDTQRVTIQREIDYSLDAIDRLAGQVENVSGSDDLSALRSGGNANPINGDVGRATELVDQELQEVSSRRAALGANDRIEQVFTEMRQDKTVILTEALSQIEDTDFATATAELAQGQVLAQASLVALAYATQQATEQMTLLMESLDATVE